jgi:hypothetical protein
MCVVSVDAWQEKFNKLFRGEVDRALEFNRLKPGRSAFLSELDEYADHDEVRNVCLQLIFCDPGEIDSSRMD